MVVPVRRLHTIARRAALTFCPAVVCWTMCSSGAAIVHAAQGARRPVTEDLAEELAVKIAAAIGSRPPLTLRVIPLSDPFSDPFSDRPIELTPDPAPSLALRNQLARTLSAHGLQVVERADGTPSVLVGCSRNLREQVCTARIHRVDSSDVVTAVRLAAPKTDHEAAGATAFALQQRLIFVGREPILDIAELGDRLLVLNPSALTLFQRTATGWRDVGSRAITSTRVWPRDLRGLLHVEEAALQVHLPGTTCQGRLDPFTLICIEAQQPWPLGIDNSGLMPGRNYFTTPEGTAFYGAAGLGPDAGARWIVVTEDRGPVFLDDRRHPLGRAVIGGDGPANVEIAASGADPVCGTGDFVLVSSRAPSAERADALRLFRVTDRRLVAASPPLVMPGLLIALWTPPGTRTATAVVREPGSGQYEAFRVDAGCGR